MKIPSVSVFCGLICVVAASGCTEPTACTLEYKTAINLVVRSSGGLEDITRTARVDVTRDGVTLPQSAVQYPGTSSSLPIGIGGSGGNYSIVVHHTGYRDTTVASSVLDAACGPTTVTLIVSLTAL